MAKSIYDVVRIMPRHLFMKMRRELRESPDFYLLTMDPRHVPEDEKSRARQKFLRFGIPERMVNTDEGLEHAAWAVEGRSTSVK